LHYAIFIIFIITIISPLLLILAIIIITAGWLTITLISIDTVLYDTRSRHYRQIAVTSRHRPQQSGQQISHFSWPLLPLP